MEPSLIFFDVDGTILDANYRVPASAAKAIADARQRGNLCFICTGRPFSHLEPQVTAIGFDGYVCACGEHILLNGTTAFRRTLPEDVCQNVLRLCREGGLDLVFESEDGVWFDHTRPLRPEAQAMCRHFAQRGFDVDRPVDRPDLQFDKFCVWKNPNSRMEPLLEYLQGRCTVIDREGDLFECVVEGCSKESGVRAVMARTGIPPARCYALGDSTNDLPMFRCVGHSIAMGNAPPEIQRAASYVTAPLHQDGLRLALEHFGLVGT